MDKWLETKDKRRHWKFKYIEYLNKKPRLLKGKIKATQNAIKVGKDKYLLVMKGRRTAWKKRK